VLVTCAGALLYFTIALVPVLGLIARGWHSRSADNWPPIPGADLLVLAIGTLAMAAAAVPVARARSLARALDIAGLSHFAGALITAALSLCVIVPWLPPWQFEPLAGARAHVAHPVLLAILQRVGSLAPYVGVQVGLGLAVALVLHWWTRGSRLRRGSELSTSRPTAERPNEVVLAALSVACFLAIEAVPVMKLLVRLTIRSHDSGFETMRTALATFSIPVVLGILVAASSAGTLARCRPGVAAALGAFLHFSAAVFIAPLGAPGYIARQLADGRPMGDAMLMGSFWFVGPYFAGIYSLMIPMVVTQTVIGAASALVFCVVARWWVRPAAG
jgi:hypothetical protein